MFIAYEVTLDAIRSLPPLIAAIKRHNRELADQLERAGQSTLPHLAEARRRSGKDRQNRYRTFAGEAAESVACLDVAIAWAYAPVAELAASRALFDHALALTWPMCKPG